MRDMHPTVRGTQRFMDQCNECCRIRAELVSAASMKDGERVADLLQELRSHYGDAQRQRALWREVVESARQQWEPGRLPAPAWRPVHVVEEDCGRSLRMPFFGLETPNNDYYQSCLFLGMLIMYDPLEHIPHVFIWDATRLGRRSELIMQIKLHFYARLRAGRLVIICDNCVAENKSNLVVWCDQWMVRMGWFRQVDRQFLPAGHSKFNLDRICSWVYNTLRWEGAQYSPAALVQRLREAGSRSSQQRIYVTWVHKNRGRATAQEEGACPLYAFADTLAQRTCAIPGIRGFYRFAHDVNSPGLVRCVELSAEGDEGGQSIVPCMRDPPGEDPFPAWWAAVSGYRADDSAGERRWECPSLPLLQGRPVSKTCADGLRRRLETISDQAAPYLREAIEESEQAGAPEAEDLTEEAAAAASESREFLVRLRGQMTRTKATALHLLPFGVAESLATGVDALDDEGGEAGGDDADSGSLVPERVRAGRKRRQHRRVIGVSSSEDDDAPTNCADRCG